MYKESAVYDSLLLPIFDSLRDISMIRSMTGYGKSTCSLSGLKLSIEVRTLNSKQLDLSIKTPSLLSAQEAAMRKMASEKMQRGKVSVQVNLERVAGQAASAINHELALSYYKELKELADKTGSENSDLLAMIMRIPEVSRPAEEELPAEDVSLVLKTMEQALQQCDEFRSTEGASLGVDLEKRVWLILGLLEEIEPFEMKRVERIRSRVREELLRSFKDEDVDKSRFEQELVYYLEKLDITEERVRLKGHCQHFLDVMKSNGTQGKKLGFISQEMGREINTIGSKANDLEMQKRVVLMKDELEKIKEQTLNIL